jgi:hypothetical protein
MAVLFGYNLLSEFQSALDPALSWVEYGRRQLNGDTG